MDFRFLVAMAAVALSVFSSCTKDPLMMNGGGSSEGEAADFDDSAEIVPGWIRIKLADDSEPLRTGVFTRGGFDSGDVRLDELAAGLGATEIRRVFRDGGRFEERHRRYGLHLWYDIRIADEVPVSRARAEMVSLPGVDVVEPVYRVRLAEAHVVPDISDRLYRPFSEGEARPEPAPFNDPELSRQWHYNNDGSIEGSVAGADINLFKAWREIGAGRPEVVVAVIDGGIQYDHPDLAANMWTNEAEMNGTPGVDDDGNGYVDDIYGWNYYTDSGTITQHFHGTHVAGTVAAVNNNGIGVCGVAGGTGVGDGVRLMSCQNYDTDANGQEVGSVTEESFIYAADNGAVIAQCSWGYNGIETPLSMQRAIQYFIREAGTDENGVQTGPMKGGVVCFSAGNSSYSHVGNPGDMEEVVGVTAMGPDYKKAGYSNYGSAADLFAPGGASSANPEDPKQVYSTYINGGYAYLWGTSMACPHVSGVAALIVSYYGVDTPGFTAERCREILLRSFRPVGEYVAGEPYADGLGAGLVDASLILLENPGIKPGSVEELTLTPLPDGMAIAAAMPADGNGDAVSKIRLGYAPVNGDGTTGEWREETFPNIQPAGGIFTTELQLAAEETYRVRMSVEDRYGNVSDEVTDEATTLPHVNVAPSYRGIETQLFTSTGKGFSKTVALDSYFSDPDIPYGDELTFAFDDGEQEILEVVLEGAELLLTPIYKGQTEIVVTATDRAGESASGTFRVRIVSGDEPPAEPEPDPEPDPDPDPDPDPVPGFDGDTMVVVPNPVGEALTVYVPHVASM
ncbi:MAG TPA: S8 family serine peptidase, partial [Tidjanibacter sp.]|nr:S8 family serine peptidase [Tidjanibacter sp.]